MDTESTLPFTRRVKSLIQSIPKGRVATYGQIASFAGNPLGARQVAWILHSSSAKEKLPWHRVINSRGKISLKPGYGFELQRELLKKEGIKLTGRNTIDLKRFLWKPEFYE
ncbi:MAG: MGMT family protein [Spirochaetota bacterium]